MGGDGGSIVGRKELVQTAKRETTAHSQRSQSRAQVNSCALSHAPLRAPVVACGMGLLFNKDSLIEYLLAKQRFPHLSHVQQLKDVRDVTLHWNKEATVAADKAKAAGAGASLPASSPLSALPLLNDSDNAPPSSADAEQPALYSCPITGLPSNGVNRFVALLPCGCVVSERAMKSVAGAAKGAADTCMVCGKELACDAPPSPTHVAALAAADSAAAAASSAGAASVAADSTTAAPAAAAAPSRSPFYHPSYLTLFPGKEETLYLRAQMAEMLKQRELDKAAKKAVKKAAAASAATATGADGEQLAGHKRKADGEGSEARASKKAHAAASGAHSKLVASTTGSSMAERVRAITAQAAQAVAERRKDEKFNGMFLSQKQLAETKFDSISTKPASLMSLL